MKSTVLENVFWSKTLSNYGKAKMNTSYARTTHMTSALSGDTVAIVVDWDPLPLATVISVSHK